MRKFVPAIALIALVAACSSSVPTSPSAVDATPRFDGGFGMGSGNVVGEPDGNDSSTQTQTATTSTNVVAEDTTSRGGFGMGSGN